MNASFALPMKYTRALALGEYLAGFLPWLPSFCFPAVAASFTTLPHLGKDVYAASGFTILWHVAAFGAGWGLAQVFFGIAVDAIGIALTFSLVLGTSAAIGALIPMLLLHS